MELTVCVGATESRNTITQLRNVTSRCRAWPM